MIKNKIINYTIFAFSFFVWSNLHILHQPDSGQNCIFRGTKSSKVEKKRIFAYICHPPADSQSTGRQSGGTGETDKGTPSLHGRSFHRLQRHQRGYPDATGDDQPDVGRASGQEED